MNDERPGVLIGDTRHHGPADPAPGVSVYQDDPETVAEATGLPLVDVMELQATQAGRR